MTGLVADRNPGVVLDLGCGMSDLLQMSAGAVPTTGLTGVDFSSRMLKQARRIVPAASLIAADIAGDLTIHELPRFDAIVASYVLHEFPDEAKLKLIERLRRDLHASAGLIVIGDIGFATAAACQTTRQSNPFWDESEHYMAADEFIPDLASRGIRATWARVSFCAGVLANGG